MAAVTQGEESTMRRTLKMSDAVTIGLHMAAYLAANPARLVTSREIAEVLGASLAHCSKVLHRLVRQGIVRSVRGTGGGFRLARPPAEVPLQDVYEAIEGPLKPDTCLLGGPVCEGDRCIFGGLVEKVNALVCSYLSETTLADVADVYGSQ
jgi:Rrf2 family protein